MDELIKNAPGIIEAAGKTPLALVALGILMIGGLALFLFRNASESTRIIIFVLVFLGGLGAAFMLISVLFVPQVNPGFASGYPTSGCGCWGYVSLGATRRNTSCASGLDTAVPCPGVCYGGGSPWQSVCQ